MKSTDWFKKAGWGLMAHYLAIPPSTTGGQTITVEQWNEQVNSFDIKGLAAHVKECGAGYFMTTLGQNSGFYISPNETYDSLVKRHPSRCSERDIIAELSAELSRYGIPLLVYLPSHAPASDLQAVEGLECTPEWDASKWQLKPGTYSVTPETDERLSRFQRNWEAVIREWSLRWGDSVKGWWFDGCYYPEKMYDHSDEPNFASFAAAARAGNPDSIVAFNNGIKTPVVSLTEFEDYTAGEVNRALPVFDKRYPVTDSVDGAQYHLLTFAGERWGVAPMRFAPEFIKAYTCEVNRRGGVITWDVPISTNGLIDAEAVETFKVFTR